MQHAIPSGFPGSIGLQRLMFSECENAPTVIAMEEGAGIALLGLQRDQHVLSATDARKWAAGSDLRGRQFSTTVPVKGKPAYQQRKIH